MSRPRSLVRPPGVRDGGLPSAGGRLATLEVPATAEQRGIGLLLPGFTGSKEDFSPLLPLLGAGGYAVVAVDLPGQNASPHARHSSDYAPAALAEALVPGLEHLVHRAGGPVHLLGHSYGGLVARAVAGAAPQLLASLTLLCSGPGALPAGARREDAELLLASLPQLSLAEAWEVKQAREGAAGAATGEVAAFLRQRWLDSDRNSYLGMARVLVGQPDDVDALAAVVARTGLRVLVAHGQRDDAWNATQQADMATRLGAALAVVPGAAHSPAIETPELLAALLLGHWAASPR